MTVTSRNLGEVAGVVREGIGLGFGMLSFQPAAYVGNPKRWRDDFHAADIDTVWREIERGAGTRLPWSHLQMGDERCNRAAYGVLAAGRWTPLLDEHDPRDLSARD
ncbi:MAG: radical SAM domain-containing protein, partial [Solirubrobacteraceae bacterium]